MICAFGLEQGSAGGPGRGPDARGGMRAAGLPSRRRLGDTCPWPRGREIHGGIPARRESGNGFRGGGRGAAWPELVEPVFECEDALAELVHSGFQLREPLLERQCLRGTGHQRGSGGAEQVHPAVLFHAGKTFELHGERLRFAFGEAAERIEDRVEIRERVEALGARAQFAGRLRAAQQKHGDHGLLAAPQAEALDEAVAVSDDAAARFGQRVDPAPLLKLAERGQDGGFVVIGDRFAVRLLVAGGDQRVEGEGVIFGSRKIFFRQRAQHTDLYVIEAE